MELFLMHYYNPLIFQNRGVDAVLTTFKRTNFTLFINMVMNRNLLIQLPKILSVMVFLIGFLPTAQSQSIARYHVNFQGGVTTVGAMQIQWTVGELVGSKLTVGNQEIASGFVQALFPIQINSGSSLASACVGGVLHLTADSFPNAGYSWSGPNGYTAITRTITKNPFALSDTGYYVLTAMHPEIGMIQDSIWVTYSTASQIGLAPTISHSICQGDSVLLRSTGATTYLWSTGATSATIRVNSAGTYRVGGMDGNGCPLIPDSVAVSIIPALPAPVISGAQTVTIGQNTTLSASGSGTVFEWWSSPIGGHFLGTGALYNTLIVNTSNTFYALTSLNACSSPRTPFTVQGIRPLLIPNLSVNTPVCAGNVIYIQVSNTVPSGTYSWLGPNGFSSTQRNLGISNASELMSGYYRLQVDSASILVFLDSIQVQVNTPPSGNNISVNSPVCAGNTLLLSVSPIPNATYQWTGPAGASGTQNSLTIPGTGGNNSGLYQITTNLPGCPPNTRQVPVTIYSGSAPNPGSNSPICQRGVVYFTAASLTGASYSWIGPNGFSSQSQNPAITNSNPTQSGLYTLTVYVPGCGSVSGTTQVEIGSNLTSLSISSNSPVCAGYTLSLSSTPLVNGSVNWTGPDGFTSTNADISRLGATLLMGGVYTFQASSPGCGSITRTLNALIHPNTLLNAGSNGPICQGNVLALSVNSIPNAIYSWAGPLGFASTLRSPSISNAQASRSGIYTLLVSSPTCGLTSTTTTVVVGSSLNSLSFSHNGPVCAGNNLHLSAPVRQGYVYQWSGPNGFTSALAQPVRMAVTSGDAGNYSVSIISAGCGSTTITRNILVNSGSSLTATVLSPICVGSPAYFQANGPAGTTYSWTGPAGFADNRKNPSRNQVQVIHAGVYTVTGNIPGCGSVSATTNLVVNVCRTGSLTTEELESVSEELISESSFQLYPNPTRGKVQAVVIKPEHKPYKLEVLDALGHEVLVYGKSYRNAVGDLFWDLDLNNLTKGIYLVRVLSGTEIHTERLLVQ